MVSKWCWQIEVQSGVGGVQVGNAQVFGWETVLVVWHSVKIPYWNISVPFMLNCCYGWHDSNHLNLLVMFDCLPLSLVTVAGVLITPFQMVLTGWYYLWQLESKITFLEMKTLSFSDYKYVKSIFLCCSCCSYDSVFEFSSIASNATDWTASHDMFLKGESGLPIWAAATGCFLVRFLIKAITPPNKILMEGKTGGGGGLTK